ncbi:plasmid stabilization system protein ParE [Bradyrhizobium sp. USDA 10063]
MKVVYTNEARENLAAILEYTATHYPQAYDGLRSRLQSVVARIARGPIALRKSWDGRVCGLCP